MKTIKLNIPLLVGDKHHEKGDVVLVVDSIADQLIRRGDAEKADGAEAVNADANKLKDAVDPLVPNADPYHAANALGLVTEEHPGLVALETAAKSGAPRRAAKVIGKATE